MEQKKRAPYFQSTTAAALLLFGSFSLPTDLLSPVPPNLKWPLNSEVGYRINLANAEQDEPEDGTQDNFRAAIVNAANTWNQVADVNFKLVDQGDSTTTAGYNGINEVIFQNRPDSQRAGITQAYLINGEVVEVDTVINTKFDFDVTGTPLNTELDLQSVALHEFGHWLVLDHSERPLAIMYPLIKPGTVRRDLDQEDKSRMQRLYKPTVSVSQRKIDRNGVTSVYKRQRSLPSFRKYF